MIRILTGKFKNSVLKATGKVRPTPSVVRKAIVDMFRIQIFDGVIGDFFAGSGSFGIECLSNDAKKIVFFENDLRVINVLKGNLYKLYKIANSHKPMAIRENENSDSPLPTSNKYTSTTDNISLENKFDIVKMDLLENMVGLLNVLSSYNFSLSFISPPFIFYSEQRLFCRLLQLFDVISRISKITILQFPAKLKNIPGKIKDDGSKNNIRIKTYGDNSICIYT